MIKESAYQHIYNGGLSFSIEGDDGDFTLSLSVAMFGRESRSSISLNRQFAEALAESLKKVAASMEVDEHPVEYKHRDGLRMVRIYTQEEQVDKNTKATVMIGYKYIDRNGNVVRTELIDNPQTYCTSGCSTYDETTL